MIFPIYMDEIPHLLWGFPGLPCWMRVASFPWMDWNRLSQVKGQPMPNFSGHPHVLKDGTPPMKDGQSIMLTISWPYLTIISCHVLPYFTIFHTILPYYEVRRSTSVAQAGRTLIFVRCLYWCLPVFTSGPCGWPFGKHGRNKTQLRNMSMIRIDQVLWQSQ